MSARKTPKTAVYRLLDDATDLAVIRCPEGDRAEFDRLVTEYFRQEGTDPSDYVVAEPEWHWYRMNPQPSDSEYAWVLARPKGPGPGNWVGAILRVSPATAQVSP